jgi:3-oxo-5-alpha-steroid 4-dehydrogenase 1
LSHEAGDSIAFNPHKDYFKFIMHISALLAVTEILLALVVFIALRFISALYGRHFRKGWGAAIPARWGWMIMEFPAFAVIALVVFVNTQTHNPMLFVFLAFWEFHYLYRVFVYPFLLTSPEKPFPLLLVVFALVFNSLNGLANGLGLAEKVDDYTVRWLTDPRFIIGAVIFFAGFLLHYFSDQYLRKLRRISHAEYQIPQSKLFSLISCPNYLGEIIEWTSWAIATWSLPGLAFAVFTIANLAPRAWSNHQWYRNKFKDYPANRRVLIPFVW